MATSTNTSPIIQLTALANFPIRLTTSNYSVWRKQIQSALIGLALEGYIDGTTKASAKYSDTTQTTVNPAYLAWYRQDHVILNAILGSCTDSIQPTISSALTPKAAWDRLKESFASPCRTRIVSLKSKLASNPINGRSIEEFLDDMFAISDALVLAQSPVSEEDLVVTALAQLGDEFEPIVEAICVRPEPITFSELKNVLIAFEHKQKKKFDAQHSLLATANATQKSSNRQYQPNRNSSGRNSNNQHVGINSSRPTQSFTNTNKFGRKNVTCRFCNIYGHEVRDCRKLMRFLRDNNVNMNNFGQQPAVINAIASPHTGSQQWLFDSGASHHAASSPSLLQSVSDYGGPDEIQLGDVANSQILSSANSDQPVERLHPLQPASTAPITQSTPTNQPPPPTAQLSQPSTDHLPLSSTV
ncbi:PREDICTED: uncharacterized protein LOC109174787 [Ipomoea nil]|uniref:uncharacterized protein LOC109174787 n=1 Tax=Ipomoea nil TaxID=35883 RepID=UPI0009012C42|nr:PREDICTED: uncharacterized protein LOC109174787 [Ipomoea nil]